VAHHAIRDVTARSAFRLLTPKDVIVESVKDLKKDVQVISAARRPDEIVRLV